MIISKRKCLISLLFSLMIFFANPTPTHAQGGYKIVSYKGTVKVKKDGEVNQLSEPSTIHLAKNDAVMVYLDSSVEIEFPTGNRETFTGPFYSTLISLEKPFDESSTAFFRKPELWNHIKTIFDQEGEEEIGTTRGTTGNQLNFYDEINQVVAGTPIENQKLSPAKEKEMNEKVKQATPRFNAFTDAKKIIIGALIQNRFGMYKTALWKVFSYYKKILHHEDKQSEIEPLENALFEKFLPIVVTIHDAPPDKTHARETAIKKTSFKINKKFSANYELWWAVLYYNGKKLEVIDNTTKDWMVPQDTYKPAKSIPLENPAKHGNKRGKEVDSQCIFIMASPSIWELEKLADKENAKKEFLEKCKKETRSKTILDFGKVIIRLPLPAHVPFVPLAKNASFEEKGKKNLNTRRKNQCRSKTGELKKSR